MASLQSRRRFISALSLAGTVGLFPLPDIAVAEERLETRSIRFAKNASICIFPQLFLQAMLRAEGFAEIGYVEAASAARTLEPLGLGAADFAISFALPEILEIEAGSSITILGGLHAGCYELFARNGITSVPQLKGRRVGLETASPALLSLMAANVGLDPKNLFSGSPIES